MISFAVQLLTSGKELAEEGFVLVVVHVCVAPEQHGWRRLGHGDAFLVGRLVQELIGVVLITWRNNDETEN